MVAVSAVLLAGCTSGGDEAPSSAPSAAGSATTGPPESGGASAPAESPGATAEESAASPQSPSAIVRWGDNESAFVLVQCDDQASGSLTASGDDVAGGQLLTISVADGKGDLSITEDATLQTTLDGIVTELSWEGTAFRGAGTYESKSGEQRQLSFTGDCKDL